MGNPSIENYIATERASGRSDDQIRQALINTGWQAADVDQALGHQSVPPPPMATGEVSMQTAAGGQSAQASVQKKDWFTPRVKTVMKWSVIGYAIYQSSQLIHLSLRGYWRSSIADLLTWAISSVIVGGIIGFVLAHYWPRIQSNLAKYPVLRWWGSTMFRFIFAPTILYIIFGILSLGAFSSFFAFSFGFGWAYIIDSFVFGLVLEVVLSFIYAKIMQKKVEPLVSGVMADNSI